MGVKVNNWNKFNFKTIAVLNYTFSFNFRHPLWHIWGCTSNVLKVMCARVWETYFQICVQECGKLKERPLSVYCNPSAFCKQFKISEPCHAKTGLTIFVVVIPKEGLAGISPATPPFGVTPEYRIALFCLDGLYSVVSVILKEGLAWLVPAKPSFGMTTTNILRPV